MSIVYRKSESIMTGKNNKNYTKYPLFSSIPQYKIAVGDMRLGNSRSTYRKKKKRARRKSLKLLEIIVNMTAKCLSNCLGEKKKSRRVY